MIELLNMLLPTTCYLNMVCLHIQEFVNCLNILNKKFKNKNKKNILKPELYALYNRKTTFVIINLKIQVNLSFVRISQLSELFISIE